jgi:hypothetical protein
MIRYKAARPRARVRCRPPTRQNRAPGRAQPGQGLRSLAETCHEEHHNVSPRPCGRLGTNRGRVDTDPGLRRLVNLVN